MPSWHTLFFAFMNIDAHKKGGRLKTAASFVLKIDLFRHTLFKDQGFSCQKL